MDYPECLDNATEKTSYYPEFILDKRRSSNWIIQNVWITQQKKLLIIQTLFWIKGGINFDYQNCLNDARQEILIIQKLFWIKRGVNIELSR